MSSSQKFRRSIAIHDFAAQKVVAEIKEEQEKVKKWYEVRPAWEKILKQVEAGLCDFEKELRMRYSIAGDKKWKIFQVANVSASTSNRPAKSEMNRPPKFAQGGICLLTPTPQVLVRAGVKRKMPWRNAFV
jgi:hypothetical protein